MSKINWDELAEMPLDNAAKHYDTEIYGNPKKGESFTLTEEKASEFIIDAFKAGAAYGKLQAPQTSVDICNVTIIAASMVERMDGHLIELTNEQNERIATAAIELSETILNKLKS